jgi:hypothetical protein
LRKMKMTATAAVAVALMAGCSASGGGHPQVTHANTSTLPPNLSPAPGGLSVKAACARFRSATIVMLESGPTDPAALRRFGRTTRHLGGELAGEVSGGPDRALGNAFTLVGAHALTIAAGHTPKGLIAAYRVVKRDAAKVDAACSGASQ